MRFTGFIGPSYTLQSLNVDCQRCVNLYPEINELGTGKEKEVASLVSSPGLRLLLTLPTLPVRGLWRASNGTLFAVGGNKLYSVSSSWAATTLGTLLTTTGPVSMADNGLQLVVVDGPNGYSWTIASNTFAQIADPNFLGANQVTFQDGYFLFNKPNSQTEYNSGLYALTFSGLDVAAAEGSPDNLVGLISFNQNLYLFGTQSTEVFYNSGAVNAPFTRIQGAINDVGCASAFSIAKLANSLFFLGGDSTGTGVVYRMQGYQTQRVSTPAVEEAIRSVGATNIGNARAWAYQKGGHAFYVLNLPGYNSTWVYDAQTSLWHERAYLNLWSLERHRADCHALAYGENVVGDYANGNIYALDYSKYTDNGTTIVRKRAAPHISQDMVRLFHNSFQLDLEVGVGLDGAGQGTDPQVMLRYSDDGGHSWSNERWASIGKIGQTKVRALFRRLGSSRDRVYEVTISDPVKVTLIGAELGIQGGAA